MWESASHVHQSVRTGGTTGGVVARRGRPDLSPAVPLPMVFPLSCRVPALWEWGWVWLWHGRWGRAGGGGAPPDAASPVARTKYIAPVEVHGGS